MKLIHRLILAPILSLALLLVARGQVRVWQHEVPDQRAWESLSAQERDATYMKFILNIKSGEMFFIDANAFKLHVDFYLKVLLQQPRSNQAVKNFNLNYGVVKPQFILGYITYYSKLKLWTFSFWEGDKIAVPDVIRAYRALQKSFFARDLVFRPDSVSQERMAAGLVNSGIEVVPNDKIYSKLPFQAFQVGEATGVLRIVPADMELEDVTFHPTDIVLLNRAYPDISPVAGIITTQFSTPLAHVNLRASAWGIPNAVLKDAATSFDKLNGKTVVYAVTEKNLSLREASPAEVDAFKARAKATRAVVIPKADLEMKELRDLDGIRLADRQRFGSKTSNLGEIAHARLSKVNVPSGFGVPFFYYAHHLKTNPALSVMIDEVLRDSRFNADPVWRRDALRKLRKSIVDAPLASEHLDAVTRKWKSSLHNKGVYVRSSTNAEDLENFNGAGLYDTVPNVKTREGLEAAIKQVWASIWNDRAVVERERSGIDHRSVFPGVLIQEGIDATAAGVLLTTDIWGHNRKTFTINAKWGAGIRVVEGTNIPEQVLYDWSNHGTRIISRSSETTMLVFDRENGLKEVPVPKGDTILTETRASVLGRAVKQIEPLFPTISSLDIEWVLRGETFWIVQCRPYVQAISKIAAVE